MFEILFRKLKNFMGFMMI